MAKTRTRIEFNCPKLPISSVFRRVTRDGQSIKIVRAVTVFCIRKWVFGLTEHSRDHAETDQRDYGVDDMPCDGRVVRVVGVVGSFLQSQLAVHLACNLWDSYQQRPAMPVQLPVVRHIERSR